MSLSAGAFHSRGFLELVDLPLRERRAVAPRRCRTPLCPQIRWMRAGRRQQLLVTTPLDGAWPGPSPQFDCRSSGVADAGLHPNAPPLEGGRERP
jgi:hypothetical protein